MPLIKKVYDSENIAFEALSEYVPAAVPQPSKVSFCVESGTRILSIRVDFYGYDYKEYIAIMLEAIKDVQIDVVTAFINIGNAEALRLYENCKKDGYIFCRVLPASLNGDYIIIQKFVTLPLDTTLSVLTEQNKELLGPIKEMNALS